jgi:hypothetical protein
LSGLIREQLGSTLVLHSDQQRILDSALESAIAQLVMQIGGAGREIEDHQHAPVESPETGTQRALNSDITAGSGGGVPLLDEGTEGLHSLGWSSPFIISSDFVELDDFGDIETLFH